MKRKATLNLSPQLQRVHAEAEAMGVSFPSLLTADIVRLRQLADAAAPHLTERQWGVLADVLDGIEAKLILLGDDSIPLPSMIVSAIDLWTGDDPEDPDIRDLHRQVLSWKPLTIIGVLMRLRRS